jgi:hypothetical protein
MNGNFVRYEDPTYTAYVERVRDTADAFADPNGLSEHLARADRWDDYAPSPRWERLAALVQPAGPGLTPAHKPVSVGRSHGGEG